MIFLSFLGVLYLSFASGSNNQTNGTLTPTAITNIPTVNTMSPTANPTGTTSTPTIAAFPYCNAAANCAGNTYETNDTGVTLNCIGSCQSMTVRFYEFAYIRCGWESCQSATFYCYKGCNVLCFSRSGCHSAKFYLYENSTVASTYGYAMIGSQIYCYGGCNVLCNSGANICQSGNFYFYDDSYLDCVGSRSCMHSNVYVYGGYTLIDVYGGDHSEFRNIDMDVYGGTARVVTVGSSNYGSLEENRFTVHSQGTLIIECTQGVCEDLEVKNYGNLKLVAGQNDGNPFFGFHAQNYNYSNITVFGCDYTINICNNMTWLLYNNSNMQYINNYKLFPIYLFNDATCTTCTGTIIRETNSPSISPTLYPSITPTFTRHPTMNPTFTPTTGSPTTLSPTAAAFPYCVDTYCQGNSYNSSVENVELTCLGTDSCDSVTVRFNEFAYIRCGWESCHSATFYCHKGCNVLCYSRTACQSAKFYLYENSTVESTYGYAMVGSQIYCYGGCNVLCNSGANVCQSSALHFYDDSYLDCVNSQSCMNSDVYIYGGYTLINVHGGGSREFHNIDMNVYGGVVRLVTTSSGIYGSLDYNRFTVHSQGTLIIECTQGICEYLEVKNYGNLKLVAGQNGGNPFFGFSGKNYNYSNITVFGCDYTINICNNMTWLLYNNSNMQYINNYKLFPIYLFDDATCTTCTGNIITESPTSAPTSSPTDIPTDSPSSLPTNFPTNHPTSITDIPTLNPTATNITARRSGAYPILHRIKLVCVLSLAVFFLM